MPDLAADLAKLDAQTRIDQTYQFALQKARTMGEVYQANELRGEALKAVNIKSATDDPTKYLSTVLSSGKTMQSLTGMQSAFAEKLASLFAAAPANVRGDTTIMSGYRSIERQTELWQQALAKYGSPEAARKWVAPPGNSQHNLGNAADLTFQSPEAKQWFHDNAAQNGLTFPLGNEPWHIEDSDARDKQNGEEFERRAAAMKEQADGYNEVINGSKQFVRSQTNEQQARGMSAEKAAAFRHKQEMLQQAAARGIPLTDRQRQQIAAYAAAMGRAEAATVDLRRQQQSAAQVAHFFGEQAVDSLAGLIDGTLTATDALRNLASALLKAALQALILGEGPFAGIMGGGGLLKLFGFAEGGFTGEGGKHEPAGLVHRGEYVFSKKAVGRLGARNLEAAHQSALKGFADGGYVGTPPRMDRQSLKSANINVAQPITINAPVTVNANGGTPEANADLAKQMAKQIEGAMRSVVVNEIKRQSRTGNMLGRR